MVFRSIDEAVDYLNGPEGFDLDPDDKKNQYWRDAFKNGFSELESKHHISVTAWEGEDLKKAVQFEELSSQYLVEKKPKFSLPSKKPVKKTVNEEALKDIGIHTPLTTKKHADKSIFYEHLQKEVIIPAVKEFSSKSHPPSPEQSSVSNSNTPQTDTRGRYVRKSPHTPKRPVESALPLGVGEKLKAWNANAEKGASELLRLVLSDMEGKLPDNPINQWYRLQPEFQAIKALLTECVKTVNDPANLRPEVWYGLGASGTQAAGRGFVVEIEPGKETPAYIYGLRKEACITHVNDVDIRTWTLEQVIGAVRAEPGKKPVTLTFTLNGETKKEAFTRGLVRQKEGLTDKYDFSNPELNRRAGFKEAMDAAKEAVNQWCSKHLTVGEPASIKARIF